jgi:hypothetical protein
LSSHKIYTELTHPKRFRFETGGEDTKTKTHE